MKLFRSNEHNLTTTVGELVAELLKLDQNSYVFTEGCDCIGNVVNVIVERDGTVLIERDDHALEWTDDYKKQVVAERYRDRVAQPSNEKVSGPAKAGS